MIVLLEEIKKFLKILLIEYKEELKRGVSNFFVAVCDKEDDYYLYADEIIQFFCESLNCSPEYLLKGIDYIPDNMFCACKFIESFDIPDYITYIGGFAFCGCGFLTEINIPNSVTRIDEEAFTYCGKLAEVTIPDSVTYIGEDVFYNCLNLTLKIDENNQYAIDYAEENDIDYELV